MKTRLSHFAVAATLAAVLSAPRGSSADAPPGHYTIGSGAAAGTVYDTKSKLTWQQTVSATTYTWTDAGTYCAGLSLNGTGWRLPTARELFSLVDRTKWAPAIDPTAFPGTPPDSFWSSTNVPSFAYTKPWSVYFYNGSVGSGGDPSTPQYVRCVR
jgi:hypothetical protein